MKHQVRSIFAGVGERTTGGWWALLGLLVVGCGDLAEPAGAAGGASGAGGGGVEASESSKGSKTTPPTGEEAVESPPAQEPANLCRPASASPWEAGACVYKGTDMSRPDSEGACCIEAKLGKLAPSCYALCELNRQGFQQGTVWDAYVAKSEDCSSGAAICETWNILVDPAAAITAQLKLKEAAKKLISVTMVDSSGSQPVTASLHGVQLAPWGSSSVQDLPQPDGSVAPSYIARLGMVPNSAPGTLDASTDARTKPDGAALTTDDGKPVYGDNSKGAVAPDGPSLNSSLWTVLKAEGGVTSAYSSSTAYDITKVAWSDWGTKYTLPPTSKYPTAVIQTPSPKDKSGSKSQCLTYVDLEGKKSVVGVDSKSYKVATAAAAIRTSIKSNDLWDTSGEASSVEPVSCGPKGGSPPESSPKVTQFPRVITGQLYDAKYKSGSWVDYCNIDSPPSATRCGYNEGFENAIYWGGLVSVLPWLNTTPTLENFCDSTKSQVVSQFGALLCQAVQGFYYSHPAEGDEPAQASPAQSVLNGILQGILTASDYSLLTSDQSSSVKLSEATFTWKVGGVASCTSGVRSSLGYQVLKLVPKK